MESGKGIDSLAHKGLACPVMNTPDCLESVSAADCPAFVTSDASKPITFSADWNGHEAARAKCTEWQLQGVIAMTFSAEGFPYGQAPYVASPGPFYFLGEYERNGHDDSDFFVTFWDDATQTVQNVEFMSTRYGGGWNYSRDMENVIPVEVVARIRANVYKRTLASHTYSETLRCESPEPEQMPFGTCVRLTANSRKGCKTPYTKGETGEVFDHYWFGTFYARGYNQRTRGNGRLGLRMSDGRKVFCAMTIAQLDQSPDIGKCERSARQLADSCEPVRCPGAWWSQVNAKPFATVRIESRNTETCEAIANERCVG